MKYKYKKISLDNLGKHNINRLLIEKIPFSSFVLDIGCGAGSMGEYLIKNKNCKVYGIEQRKDEFCIAKNKLTKVINANIENDETINKILEKTKKKKFDVVIASSVIEHMAYPDKFLKKIKKVIKNKGLIIITTPNIAHWSTRMSLLKGNFDYSEYGILDNTHLHFFTIKTFKNLFKKNGFNIREILIDPEGGGFPRFSIFLSRIFPGIFAYQILIVGKNK